MIVPSQPHRRAASGAPPASVLLALLTVLATGCGAATTAVDAGGASAVPAQPKRCVLLTTNDSEAEFDGDPAIVPRGEATLDTLARVVGARAAAEIDHPGSVLLLEAGDVLQGRYMQRKDGDRGRAARETLAMYEAAGYDLGTIGNHEFDAGPAMLAEALAGVGAHYTLLNTNLARADTTLADPPGRVLLHERAMRDCGGLKIGFFGVLTPSTRQISSMGDVRFRDSDDPVHGPARAAVAALREAGAEIVVAITHLGVEHDLALAAAVDGIDVIVGGHSHTPIKEWLRVGQTFVTQSGSRFSWLGRIDLIGRASGGLDTERSTWKLQPVDASSPVDAATRERLATFRAAYASGRVIGSRSVAWVLTGDARHEYGKRAARAVAHFARQHGVAVDGAMLNSGGLRSQRIFEPGPVLDLDVKAIHPFDNRLVVVDLDGRQLRQAMEHVCVEDHGEAAGRRVQLADIAVTCDVSKPALRYRMADGAIVGIKLPGERVRELRIGGALVEPGRHYRIATNDYMARGGSGHWQLSQVQRRCLDDRPFGEELCPGGATVADAVSAAVSDGSLDQPLTQPAAR